VSVNRLRCGGRELLSGEKMADASAPAPQRSVNADETGQYAN